MPLIERFDNEQQKYNNASDAEQRKRLRDQIDSKQGYIRYLRRVQQHPDTLHAEIKRHEDAIAQHQAKIDALYATLLQADNLLETAESELSELDKQLVALKPAPTRKDLQKKEAENARLKDKIAELAAILGIDVEE